MGLVITFGVFILMVLFSIVMSIREKHKNAGFIVTSTVLLISDVLCILLIRSDTMRSARNYLVCYYVVYGWFFFGALLTITLTHT